MPALLRCVATCVVAGLLAPSPARALHDVAIMGAPSIASSNEEVEAKLMATGQFSSVDTFDITQVTPSLAQMQGYDAILVYTDESTGGTAFGNNLADYVDGGGGVVAALFATASIPLSGRFHADNYWAIQPTSQSVEPRQFLGTVFDAGHPILAGVVDFDGGSGSYRPSNDALHPLATRIANWTGGTVPLIATRSIASSRRADLGFYPPSSDTRSDFWETSSDGARIMANALSWVASDCGDGAIETGEVCDDGNPTDGDGCDSNCTVTGCGNGIVTLGESCDSASLAGRCCTAGCSFESIGTSCATDADECTLDACDAVGACTHVVGADPDGDSVPDICDNCPGLANPLQEESDSDGSGNACDLCPNNNGAVPVALTTARLAKLGYSDDIGDDSVKISGSFTTTTPFDPAEAYITRFALSNSSTGATLYAAVLLQSWWSQADATKPVWKLDSNGIKASIREAPPASMTYKFKLSAKDINLPGPALMATDDIRMTMENLSEGLCFNATLMTCVNKPTKDQCRP